MVSVISASYYLKIIKILLDEDKDIINNSTGIKIHVLQEDGSILKNFISTKLNNLLRINNLNLLSSLHCFLISTLTLTILVFILKPSLILNSTKLLSLSLFNY